MSRSLPSVDGPACRGILFSKNGTPPATDEGVVAPRDAVNEGVMGLGTVFDQSEGGKEVNR